MNVIFDVGNVLVRWAPREIMKISLAVHDIDETQAGLWADRFFGHELWRKLNLGLITQSEAEGHYARELGLSEASVATIFENAKRTQTAIPGAHELVHRLHQADAPLFALTDNVREIVEHLRGRYDFWRCFRGVVVSAEVGMMKPDPAIFRYALDNHGLRAAHTIFIDDMPANVAVARDVGIKAIRFVDAVQCEAELRDFGMKF